MVIKIVMLLIFFTIMIGVGLYCRKASRDVNGFVLEMCIRDRLYGGLHAVRWSPA